MPPIFTNTHTAWFRDYEKTGISNSLCKITKVYCMNSKGHLFCAKLLVKPLNSLKHGIQYCGYIRKVDDMIEHMIVD